MTTSLRELTIAEIGDVHLGHHNTETAHIIENLRREFPDTDAFGELDLFLIAGDLFDRLLDYSDPNLELIDRWMNDFLAQCKRRNVIVRCLYGTPSHDWQQSANMVYANNTIGANFKYVDTLSIEYIAELGIHVLYVPDEWKHDPNDVWLDVQKALAEHGLEKVDFTVLHGAFEHQLPEHVPAPKHQCDRYQNITRYFVFGGHIHKRSQNGNILAAGSFDRLCHGEEEAKGHLWVKTKADGRHEIRFIENRNAKMYVSVDCSGDSLDLATDKVEQQVLALPPGSHVRILANKTDPIILSLNELKAKYTEHFLTTKVMDQEKGKREAVNRIITPFTPAAITPDNIFDLVMTRFKEEVHDPLYHQLAENLLNDQKIFSSGRT